MKDSQVEMTISRRSAVHVEKIEEAEGTAKDIQTRFCQVIKFATRVSHLRDDSKLQVERSAFL